jgi:hypothetical protein
LEDKGLDKGDKFLTKIEAIRSYKNAIKRNFLQLALEL